LIPKVFVLTLSPIEQKQIRMDLSECLKSTNPKLSMNTIKKKQEPSTLNAKSQNVFCGKSKKF